MGQIETTFDFANDLTVIKATGKMTADDFHKWTATYYTGTVTTFILWDITDTDLSGLQAADLREDARHTKHLAAMRKGGKTAIVTGNDLEYGMSRMLEAFYEAEDMQFETQIFRGLDEARKWLGV